MRILSISTRFYWPLKKKIASQTMAMATEEVNEVAKEIQKLSLTFPRDDPKPAKNVPVIKLAFKSSKIWQGNGMN